MTIDEALHRVVRQHWLLILACIVLPVVASLWMSNQSEPLYQAAGRVQMGRDLASSTVQADAMSQRALGIARSPGVVRVALDKAGINEDPTTFAEHHVEVQRVGVSPVVEIAVTHTAPQRAATIAGSITADVIQFSNIGDRQAAANRRAALDKQIAALTKDRRALIPRLKTASPGDVLAIQAQLSALLATQTEYERQLSELDLAEASAPIAVLLDPVRAPTAPLPSDSSQQAVLAGLIGVLLGVGLAGLREALHPTLARPFAIAEAAGTSHLGDFPGRDLSSRESQAAVVRISDRLALLGRRHDTQRVFLCVVRPRDVVFAHVVAQRLRPNGPRTTHRLDCVLLESSWVDPTDGPAAVVLSPRKIRAKELRPTLQLLEGLGWPVLGLVTYGPERRVPLLRSAPSDPVHVSAKAVSRT